jgi:hypothetical protein
MLPVQMIRNTNRIKISREKPAGSRFLPQFGGWRFLGDYRGTDQSIYPVLQEKLYRCSLSKFLPLAYLPFIRLKKRKEVTSAK